MAPPKIYPLLTPYVVVRLFFAPVLAVNYVAEWQREGFWVEFVSIVMSTGVLVWFSINGTAYQSLASCFAVLCIANLGYRSYLMQRLGVKLTNLLRPAALQIAALAALWLAARLF